MMGRVARNSVAENDLTDIWLVIARDSIDAADRWMDELERKLQRYADFPGMGTLRDELSPGLRSFPFGAYLVFYVVSGDDIIVTRVLHGARDLKSAFEQ